VRIDVHTHILPKDLPRFKAKYGYGGFMHIEHEADCRARMLRDDGTSFREIDSRCWDVDARLADCDNDGVDVQVLSTLPVMFTYWARPDDGLDVARFLNDHLASIVNAHPRRFAALGSVPLQSPKLAIQELERCVQTLRFPGVQIGTHVNDWNLDAPEIFPFFEAASELGAAIFVHPWDMMGEARMPKYCLPWLVGMPAETSLAICSLIFGAVLERLPRLRVCFAHGGGAFPGTIGRIEQGFLTRPDLCAVENRVNPRDYVKRIYVDSLVHNRDVFKLLLELFGPDHIALGTDYPFPLGEREPGKLIESMTELDAKSKERLFSGTAKEWLGPRPSPGASRHPLPVGEG
jgi:aminocarboxymuconate-semialdehyde decarboxylase